MARAQPESSFVEADRIARLAMDLRVRRWRLRAEECRAVARTMTDHSRKSLLDMAKHCERMADRAEHDPLSLS
jgi:hypothetical protein